MVYVALFAILALLEIVSALLIFLFKDILHAVIALSATFIFNSALFLLLGQPLLALLQLFIMVGGVSAYMFVGVAAGSYSKFKHMNFLVFFALIAIIIAALYFVTSSSTVSATGQNLLSSQMITDTLTQNAGLLYIIVAMLFGTGIGSIILMRKLGGKS